MYEKIKALVLRLLPTPIVRKFEGSIRALVALPYRGSNHKCSLCNFQLDRFIVLKNGQQLCPRCGSLARSRRLLLLVKTHIAKEFQSTTAFQILHFSPSKPLRKAAQQFLQTYPNAGYATSDISGDFPSDLQIDLTNTGLPDNQYDLIICYHILEHIEQDHLAMGELYRILKPGGTCLIQTPYLSETGLAKELENITTDADRLLHYGQEDHVRIYTVEALKLRLETAGLSTNLIKYGSLDEQAQLMGLKQEEFIIEATKPV